jgi:hypothetical protein
MAFKRLSWTLELYTFENTLSGHMAVITYAATGGWA